MEDWRRVITIGRVISNEQMQHGRPWRGEDVSGWFASEKLDGCRGYWDGERMWSRSGRTFSLPKHWATKLPRMRLDGEIFAGRGKWEVTTAAVIRNQWAPEVCFIVFDAPEIKGCWSKRIAAAEKKLRCDFAHVVPWTAVRDIEHAAEIFRGIRAEGGEGLILRRPLVPYSTQRTNDVLKLKKCPLTGELAWPERRRGLAA